MADGGTRRRQVLLLCVLGWTLFVGLSLYKAWSKPTGPMVWVVQEGETTEAQGPERFHAKFKADAGWHRVYPWILFTPYIALVAFLWPLERGRLRVNLPVNLVACAAFLVGSHLVTERSRMGLANITIIKSRLENGERRRILGRVEDRGMGDPLPEGKSWEVVEGTGPQGSGGGLEERRLRERVVDLLAEADPRFQAGPGVPSLRGWNPWSFLLDLLAYGAVAGMSHSVHFYRRLREREHRTLALESSLANARLQALRAQLQPHFLFNSLNAVAALLRRNPVQAEGMLVALSELLRLALSQSERQEIALREEMQFVECYLEIQRTRFGEKLRWVEEVEPEAWDCAVPTLLLQPLVENAIRHGIEPAEHAGIIRVKARRRNGTLVITVEDNGVGLAGREGEVAQPRSEGGIGLANLRARLEALYGENQKVDLSARPAGGLAVQVEIPWHRISTDGTKPMKA